MRSAAAAHKPAPLTPLAVLALGALVLVAFAGNSVLNRPALAAGAIDPMSFAFLRALTAAVFLLTLIGRQGNWAAQWQRPSIAGVLGLSVYLLAFSYAYVRLDAVLGALILFACVQITMFGWVTVRGGLVLLLWPSAQLVLDPLSIGLMIAAGIAWGAFSLVGGQQTRPLVATTWSFVVAALVLLVPFVALLPGAHITLAGVVWASVSGVVTSAIGYALWYRVLPSLGPTRAALAQLTVPVIAAAMGLVFLGEALSWRFVVASVLVLGGTAVGLAAAGRTSRTR